MDDKYLIVILVLATLFGASRLPSLGRSLGQGIHEFRRGLTEGGRDAAAEPPGPEDEAG